MPNAAPILDDDAYAVFEDQILKVNPASGVLVGDTDADSDNLAAFVATNPQNPLFDFKTNGTFTYDARYHGVLYIDTDGVDPTLSSLADSEETLPNGFDSLAEGAVVKDTFTYKATDGQAIAGPATVTITITGVNDDPEANDDAATVVQGNSINIDVLANDTDVDVWPTADVQTIVGLSDLADDGGPAGGSDNTPGDGLTIVTDAGSTVTLVGGVLQYDAAGDFFGIDRFEYTIDDGNGGSDTAVVRVTVLPDNVGPDAVDDTRMVNEDDGETNLASVLGNDTDADDAPLIGAYLSDPIATALRRVDSGGNPIAGDTGILVDFNSDGTFSYNPNGEFESLGVGDTAYVEFDYTAFDGHGATDEATVTIEIAGENDNPTGVSPDAVSVYEAGLANGSGDGDTTIVRDIDILISDVDASDTPSVAGTTGGNTTTLVGTYGQLEFIDNDTVRYTLQSNADHSAVQGHNGGIFDNFTVYVVDEHGGSSGPLTVSVEVIDDINFLVTLPNGGGTGDPLDDKNVAFDALAMATDTFTLIPGADGQELDVVGVPADFTLLDGRTVSSEVFIDSNGHEAVRGTDSDGDPFYELLFDPDPDSDPTTLLGQYTLTILQDAPSAINEIDFSSVKAGGPQETLTVENIKFDGAFLDEPQAGDSIEDIFNPLNQFPNSGVDDINPNSAGGIGIGNGNIERLEALCIDVTGSPADISGVRFVLQGVGGGVPGALDVLWVAVDGGTVVATGSEHTTNINAHNSVELQSGEIVDGEFVFVTPGVDFDQLYVALDPADVDGNDKVRINNIATQEEQLSDSVVLGFRVNSDDPDGDHSPLETAVPSYEEFFVTLTGGSGSLVDPGIMAA